MVEEEKSDLKDARNKNVYLHQFTYKNHKGDLVNTDNVAGLLSKIREFAMDTREEEEDNKKEQVEIKKYAAQIAKADLET